MTSYSLHQIAQHTGGILHGTGETKISTISFDSRNLSRIKETIFIALQTKLNDGHNFVLDAYEKGVRSFIVQTGKTQNLSNASFIEVTDTYGALHDLGKSHRALFTKPVIAITGSNGKTIVKEWLTQVLNSSLSVTTSPKSYNSQIGVPLSLWNIELENDLAIIEAGISQPGEMEKLQRIIAPDLGIFTNIGDAHLENFKNLKQLICEKAALFTSSKKLIVNSDQQELISVLAQLNLPLYTWGKSAENDLQLESEIYSDYSTIRVNQKETYTIPFTDNASIENCSHVIACALYLEIFPENIQASLNSLEPLEMRMQVLKGINNCIIINDSYTADLKALANVLNLAQRYSANKRTKTLILSDFTTKRYNSLKEVKSLLLEKKIDKLITIGMDPIKAREIWKDAHAYATKKTFLTQDLNTLFKDEVIMVKGARKFKLESIAQRLQLKDHRTILEINLDAFTENFNYFRKRIKSDVKIMAMVKAFSYGSGSYEVASHLAQLGAHYLGVAYADEGIELRKNGVKMPILVLNPEPGSFGSMTRHDLEPEIYSIDLLEKFNAHLEESGIKNYPIHIKLDSGMHRLGFKPTELNLLIDYLKSNRNFDLKTVFSHLAASESQAHDAFTKKQIEVFSKSASEISLKLDVKPIKHLCNSAGITRFPAAHFDMVRLGISLYGMSSDPSVQKELVLAGKLKSTIIHISEINKGETVGYGRNFIADKPTTIAIIPIGYADGMFRGLGNGNYQVTIGKQKAPFVGNICMDMAFIDITHCEANLGDEVVIFSTPADVNKMAQVMNTIPYEVLSGVSHRVKRIYYME